MRNVLNYPQDVTVLYCPDRALDSQTAGLHVVPNISKTTTKLQQTLQAVASAPTLDSGDRDYL